MKFSDWLLQRESSPATRARSAAALGLLPLSTIGSIHGHSTAAPWQVDLIKKRMKKAKKKRKNQPVNKDVDKWIKETDSLKDELKILRSVFDKKKKETPKSDPFKPELPKKEKPKEKEPEENETEEDEKKKKVDNA